METKGEKNWLGRFSLILVSPKKRKLSFLHHYASEKSSQLPQNKSVSAATGQQRGTKTKGWAFSAVNRAPASLCHLQGRTKKCGEHLMHLGGIFPEKPFCKTLPGARNLIYAAQDFCYLPNSCLSFSIAAMQHLRNSHLLDPCLREARLIGLSWG